MELRQIIWRLQYMGRFIPTCSLVWGLCYRRTSWNLFNSSSSAPSILVLWHNQSAGSYKINTDGYVKYDFASGEDIYFSRPRWTLHQGFLLINIEIALFWRLSYELSWMRFYLFDRQIIRHLDEKQTHLWPFIATIKVEDYGRFISFSDRYLLSFDRDIVSHTSLEGNQVAKFTCF